MPKESTYALTVNTSLSSAGIGVLRIAFRVWTSTHRQEMQVKLLLPSCRRQKHWFNVLGWMFFNCEDNNNYNIGKNGSSHWRAFHPKDVRALSAPGQGNYLPHSIWPTCELTAPESY